MRRIFSIIVLILTLFVITVICTSVTWLATFDELPGEMTMEQLGRGHIHLVLLTKDFWGEYPSFGPGFNTFIFVPGCLLAGSLILLVFYFLGLKTGWHGLYLGLACLGAGFIPYIAGIRALAENTDPNYCGRWIALMLLGMLYCCIACAVFAGLDIFKIEATKLIPRISLRRPYFNWKSTTL